MIAELTTGNLLSAGFALASPVAMFLMMGRKVRRENDADVSAKIAPVASDLAQLTDRVSRHVPREEIERGDARVLEVANGAHALIGDLREKYGRLDERQQASAGQLREIKQLVIKQGDETVGRFDRLQASLLEISRKVS